MSRRLFSLACLAALALVVVQGASSLSSFSDPAGDSGGAVDLTTIDVNNDGGGTISIMVITNQPTLPADALLLVGLDTDRNPSTGNDGVEYLFGLDPTGYEFVTWNGSAWVDAPATTVRVSYGAPGFARFEINKSELGNTSGFNLWVDSVQIAGDQAVARDSAPDSGSYSYTLTTPPPPAPPAPPTVNVGKVGLQAPGAHAGKTFRITAPLTTDATSVKVACAARVGTAVVRMTARYSPATGAATCSGNLPKGSVGKRVAGTMTATIAGAKDASAFSFVIRK